MSYFRFSINLKRDAFWLILLNLINFIIDVSGILLVKKGKQKQQHATAQDEFSWFF